MSGNPFRTSPQQNQAAIPSTPTISIIDGDSSRAEAPQLGTDSVHASPLPAKTKKSVRIESPTTSASHPGLNDGNDAHEQRKTRGHHAGSPPLTVHAGFSDNFSDQVVETPFNKDADNDEDGRGGWGLIGSTRKNTGMGSPAPSQISSGAPANPFSKTLATIEPQEKGTAERRDHLSDRSAAEKAGSGNTKTSLDVEGFKRLLMTGISNPTSPVSPQPQMATAPNHINPSIFESSSSTDTSSISRQSIFEPVQDTHGETPRTSYEMAASDDEEKTGLIGDVRKTPKKKPPPPKHRHGNLVTVRTPQTVSFSEFSSSFMSQAAQPTSSPIARNRTNSDLNKPLPPPPVLSPPAHIVSQDISQDERSHLQTNASESSNQSDVPTPQKKVPPPVPIARRHSQLRSSNAGNRGRSNSSLTLSSQHSTEYPLLSPSAPSLSSEPTSHPQASKPPPPPPPARRHGTSSASINTSSANSSTTELPSTSTRRTTLSSPTPPQSRRTTVSSPPPSPSPGLARTSSVSSNRNNRSVSNESAPMPPPPPPPRRRQSQRRSIDKERPLPPHSSSPTESRRTSSENKRSSFDGKRRTSVASESSLRYEYAPSSEYEQALYSPKDDITEGPRTLEPLEVPKSSPSNILDDLDKFQREIDELREKYQKAS